jgi:modulator of FtsH protease
MSTGWETTINTGNPAADQATLQSWQQQASAQGMFLQVTPMPQGGYHVKAVPMGGQAQGVGYASPSPVGGVFGAVPSSAPTPWNAGAALAPVASPDGTARLSYLRKVYGLLGGSALFAFVTGGLITSGAFGVESITLPSGTAIEVPSIVYSMLENPVLMWGAFGALFASTFIASWVSKVRVVNVMALFGVAALMGLDLAPMVWIASIKGELGMTASSAPVRDAAVMSLSIFGGITGYVFVTKKDFSYLRGFLSMASLALFAACLLTFVFRSEMFSLAIAGVGGLITMGMLLYVTSYIFRNSEMDDPVGDALALLVQLRNLFMFILRLFMSSRD